MAFRYSVVADSSPVAIGDDVDTIESAGSGRRRTLPLLPWPPDGLRSSMITNGEEDLSQLSLLLSAGDEGDALRSRQIWNRSLAVILMDGYDQSIGASSVVVLDGSGVGKMNFWILHFYALDAVIDEGERGDPVQHVVVMLLIGSDKSVGPPLEELISDEDDGAPNLVLRQCTKVCIHAMPIL
ncbi:hypothetical protein ACLOJK_034747 [Asimina triloba]